MTTLNKAALAALVMSSMVLAACGGGGGSSGSSTPATPVTPVTPVTPTTPVTSSVFLPLGTDSAYTPVNDIATDSLGWINSRRTALGLAPLVNTSAALTATANAHANYLVANKATGHTETAGLAGFTGVDPNTRINAVYPTNYWGEVVVAYTGTYSTTTAPIEILFDAPFHRSLLISDFGTAGVGYATSGSGSNAYSALNIDLADYKQVVSSTQFVAYPYNGQTNVKTSWVANESPNPFADQAQYVGATVGYPIILEGHVNGVMNITTFTVTDAAGNNVSCKAIDHNANAEANGYALCIPYAPLAVNTTYKVSAVGTEDGTAFTAAWSFTTGAATGIVAEAKVALPGQQAVQTPKVMF